MKKVLQFLRKNPEIIFFIWLFILWTVFMCNENAKEGGDFSWHDFKVEANGMIFDLFVFGILVSTYNALRSSKDKIERLSEQIEDYRGWDEKEAMYRIVGAVKRLNRVGVTKIDLSECYLLKANLNKANLMGANLAAASLAAADLMGADLKNVNFFGADLTGADLAEADLTGADLADADLTGAYLAGADFTMAYLAGARVGEDWFEKCEKWKVIGLKEIKETYEINGLERLQFI